MASTHVGSMGAIVAAKRHENHCGGIHLLDEATGEYNTSYLERHFPQGGVRQVECVYRQQGLMVAPGNPLGIASLADMARGEYLLFMDCDAMPPDDLFLSRYADCLSDGSSPDVICGGVTVPDSLPSRDVSLRYYYGLEVERKSASVRLAAPYSSFVPFNFMIRKRTFDRIRFDESFSCYGHEDTFFGFTLQERGVSITHIDNPLVHLGLEPNAVFLAKTRMSVDSLVTHYDKLCPVSRLLRFYCRLCNNGLRFLPYLLYRLCFSAMQQYLIRSARPNLKVFNLYKLAYLSAAMRKTGR